VAMIGHNIAIKLCPSDSYGDAALAKWWGTQSSIHLNPLQQARWLRQVSEPSVFVDKFNLVLPS
jgi:hypothetical protein